MPAAAALYSVVSLLICGLRIYGQAELKRLRDEVAKKAQSAYDLEVAGPAALGWPFLKACTVALLISRWCCGACVGAG